VPAIAISAFTGQGITAAEVKIKLKKGTELQGVLTPLESMIAGKKSKKADPDAIAFFPIIHAHEPAQTVFHSGEAAG